MVLEIAHLPVLLIKTEVMFLDFPMFHSFRSVLYRRKYT